MISVDRYQIIMDDLDQILVLEQDHVRCLLKKESVELTGSHFHVISLSEKELVLKGKVRTIEINER